MQQVQANGVLLSCRLTGSEDCAHASLLIHGLNANLAFWRPELVRRLGAERQLLMYDLRGHGHSEQPPAGYTPASQAEDAAGLLDNFGLDAVDVVAHSFGAVVALQLARRFPHRVRSLTLLDARCRLFQPELRLGDWPAFERWRRALAEAGIEVSPDTVADYRLPLTLETEAVGAAAEQLAACGFFAPSRGRRSADRYRRLLTETTAMEELSDTAGITLEFLEELATPTQLLYGGDSMFLPSRDRLHKTIPRSRCETFPGVGHNFPFLLPTETAEAITTFWRTLDRPGVDQKISPPELTTAPLSSR